MTPRQHDLLAYLHAVRDAGQPAPTGREMAAAIGTRHVSYAAAVARSLERQGYVRHTAAHTRCVEVVVPMPAVPDVRLYPTRSTAAGRRAARAAAGVVA